VLDLPEGPLFVLADANALRRVLCSLVENSIKYTPDGGRITLSARREFEEVVVRVSDSGCGIESADIPYVFEKYYRGRPSTSSNGDKVLETEASGIGLGLYLARKVVEEFGGSIEVEASTNQGTIIAVHMPMFREIKTKETNLVEATANS
jgi:signal transduction histidine kinase